jgi:hypothetical protein
MSETISNLAQQVQPQDFAVPTDEVPLPSDGVVYPAGSPLFNKKSVEIRSMTAKEEDILTSRALLKNGKALSLLLKSCIMDKNIDVDQMLSGDRNAVLIGIRITGYGADYDVKIQCPECAEVTKQSVDLTTLPIKRIPQGVAPIQPGKNEFEFVLPVSKKKVVFKLMTGEDEREMISIAEKTRKSGQNEELITTRHRLQIISMNGETDKQKLYQIIRNMPAKDSRSLRNHIDKITPGVDLLVPFTCNACGTEQKEVEVPLSTDFFWPQT